MKTKLQLFLIILFTLFTSIANAQLEKPKPAPKPAPTQTKPTSTPPKPSTATTTLEILWTGTGVVNVNIGSVDYPVQPGVASIVRVRPNEAMILSVKKPTKTYTHEDFVIFSAGKNYLTIDLKDEKLVVTNQNEAQHQAQLNKYKNWDLMKDSILNREGFMLKKNIVKSCVTWTTNSDGVRYKKSENFYNERGLPTSGQGWNEKGESLFTFVNDYNESWQLIRSTFLGGSSNSTSTFTYDEYGNNVGSVSEHSTSTSIFDSKGLLLEYTSTGEYAMHNKYSYNDQYQCTLAVSNDYKMEYSYDAIGNKTSERLIQDIGGGLTRNNTYNNVGLKISSNSHYYGPDYSFDSKEEYSYTYY